MSEGSRSGVNWSRRNEQSMLAARARASRVLPTPGHVLDQDVPLGQQGHDGQLDDLGLAQDDRPDVLQQAIDEGEGLGQRRCGDLGRIGGIHA